VDGTKGFKKTLASFGKEEVTRKPLTSAFGDP
jgi:hypothetical protein